MIGPGAKKVGILALSIALTSACGGDSGNTATPTSPTASPSTNGPVQVIPVNYELVAGQSSRVLIGLVLPDNRFIAYGTVGMRFTKLNASNQVVGQTSQVVTGTYLPVPGTEPGDPAADPQATSPATARGAYELEGVSFNAPGPWAVEVATSVQGVGTVQGSAQLDVLPAPRVPGVGQDAPVSDNAVISDSGLDLASIDSRASIDSKIPDPELHQVSIADAIDAQRPAVVVFSTPVFCISQFCGPVTDMVQSLAKKYGGQADFIHIEIWKDFQRSIANETANEWLLHDGTLNEPWAFIVAADGTIAARWDNLFTRPELEGGLKQVLGTQ